LKVIWGESVPVVAPTLQASRGTKKGKKRHLRLRGRHLRLRGEKEGVKEEKRNQFERNYPSPAGMYGRIRISIYKE
jgi:hypothetical protein